MSIEDPNLRLPRAHMLAQHMEGLRGSRGTAVEMLPAGTGPTSRAFGGQTLDSGGEAGDSSRAVEAIGLAIVVAVVAAGHVIGSTEHLLLFPVEGRQRTATWQGLIEAAAARLWL